MVNSFPSTPESPQLADGRFASTLSSFPYPPKQPHGYNSLLTPPSTPPLGSLAVFPKDQHAFAKVRQVERRVLSDNELSYFLPSRASGVNDMYLHHHLETDDPQLLASDRVELIWAILRVRHSLLTAEVRQGPSRRMDDWEFVTTSPEDVDDAIEEAFSATTYCSYPSSKDLILRYLNGPRLLSSSHLSHLTISQSLSSPSHFDILLATTHFVGDGMALHTLMNDFYGLVGKGESVYVLEGMLEDALEERQSSGRQGIPSSTEERLATHPQATSALKRAASRTAHTRAQSLSLGGQSFPKASTKAPVHTVVLTHAFSESDSANIIKDCKKSGVSFASALFAVVNVAWERVQRGQMDPKEPMMFYSALNLRPSLSPISASSSESYFHLSLGYYTISLPSFRPSSPSAFWQRCTSVRDQTAKATKSAFLVGKALVEMTERKERAVKWAVIDDEADRRRREEEDLAGLGIIGWKPPVVQVVQSGKPSTPPPSYTSSPPPSNAPLMGLSLLGNLDYMYSHASYPSLRLTDLTTGSRQRNGAILLFGYTFKGRTYLSLGYDQAGFEQGKIEALWTEMKNVTTEMLVNN